MGLSKKDNSGSTLIVPGGGRVIKAAIAQENISHILSRLTKLYDHPVDSTVREVYSNAVDATNLLPKELRRPVSITTPTIFEPQLIIRDYAEGMSLEVVDTVYVNYGVSLKSENLEALGFFGLGGKAPLAYCDNFSVETTHEGITTNFIMRLMDGEVESEIHSSVFTGNPSGTTVTVPVEHDDISSFEEAINVYRIHSWRTPVEIDGVLHSGSSEYVNLTPALIYSDDDGDIFGEVRLQRSTLHRVFREIYHNGISGLRKLTSFELGGWSYGADGVRQTGVSSPLVVEIVPALVEFSSSRDSITTDSRLAALNAHMENYFKSERFFEEAFAVFRHFDLDEIKTFVQSVGTGVFKVDDFNKLSVNSSYSRTPLFVGDFTLMDTEIGVNPYFLRVKSPSSSVKITFGWKKYSYRRDQELVTVRAERQSLFSAAPIMDAVGQIGSMSKIFSRDQGVGVSYIASAFYTGDQKIVLVTETDADQFKILVRRREAIRKTFDDNTYFAFAGEEEKSVNKEELSYSKKLLGDRFSTIKASVLIEKIDDARRQMAAQKRAAASAEVVDSITYSHIWVNKIEQGTRKPQHLLDELSKYTITPEREKVTLQEIVDSDSLVIYAGYNDWLRVYRGAVNSGIDFRGKTIYIINGALDRHQFKKISSIPERIFMLDAYYKLKAERELAVTRGFKAELLNSTLEGTSSEDLLKSLMPRTLSQTTFELLLEYAGETSEEFKKYLRLSATAVKENGENFYGGEVHYASFYREELARRGVDVEALNRFIQSFQRSAMVGGLLEEKIIWTALRDMNKDFKNSPLMGPVFTRTVEVMYEVYRHQDQV